MSEFLIKFGAAPLLAARVAFTSAGVCARALSIPAATLSVTRGIKTRDGTGFTVGEDRGEGGAIVIGQ